MPGRTRPSWSASVTSSQRRCCVVVPLWPDPSLRRTRLVGLAGSLPGLLAARIKPAVQAHLVAGQRSRERAHAAVLRALGLEPLLTLRLRAGEGVGACLAASMILQGLRMRRLAARTVE